MSFWGYLGPSYNYHLCSAVFTVAGLGIFLIPSFSPVLVHEFILYLPLKNPTLHFLCRYRSLHTRYYLESFNEVHLYWRLHLSLYLSYPTWFMPIIRRPLPPSSRKFYPCFVFASHMAQFYYTHLSRFISIPSIPIPFSHVASYNHFFFGLSVFFQ